jgi:hypothetical protein
VYPLEDGYRPVGQFTKLSDAIAATPKGGATFTSPAGLSTIIAGTATNLYKAFSGAWTSIGSGYSLLEEGRWRFAQFGGLAIATNGTDPMVKIDLTTDTVASLGGTPPKFETLAVVKDFLVGGVRNSQIMHLGWSGINDAEWWTVGQRQADLNILPDGGRINGILSGEYGIILQRNCIRRMDYVGGNIIFEFNVVSTNTGCVTPHSVAQWGRIAFFLSDNGFMMWDGSQAVPIGQEKIDRSFASQYDVTDWPSMSTAIDPVNRVVMWSMADKIWCYHWDFGKWTVIPIVSSIIFSGVTKAVSIDEDYHALTCRRIPTLTGRGFRHLTMRYSGAAIRCFMYSILPGNWAILTAHRWPQSSPALIWKCFRANGPAYATRGLTVTQQAI